MNLFDVTHIEDFASPSSLVSDEAGLT